MSQRGLALLAGNDRSVISRFEAGHCELSEQSTRRLAAASGLNVAEFCGLLGMRPPELWASERLTQAVLRQAYVEERRPTWALALELGVSPRTLRKHLQRQALPFRQPGELSRRYHRVEAAPFADPSTDLHAYWLGFLAAGGCVFTADGRYLVRLRLKAADAKHLRAFAAATGSDAPVTTRSGYAQVQYFDRELVAALARWGIVPNKSLTISFPHEFPEHLRSAFVRGYFDGDGSIYWRIRDRGHVAHCKFVSGSERMLDGLRATLARSGILTGKVYHGSGRALVLPVLTKRANLGLFARYVYADASVWLARKRQAFIDLALLT